MTSGTLLTQVSWFIIYKLFLWSRPNVHLIPVDILLSTGMTGMRQDLHICLDYFCFVMQMLIKIPLRLFICEISNRIQHYDGWNWSFWNKFCTEVEVSENVAIRHSLLKCSVHLLRKCLQKVCLKKVSLAFCKDL